MDVDVGGAANAREARHVGEQQPIDWTRAVAALRKRRARSTAEADRTVLGALAVRPFGRGTNALYALEHSGVAYCAKLYTASGERGAAREWAALSLLRQRGFPYAPAPVHFDDADMPHAVVMTRLGGTTMRHRRLTRPMLAALAETLQAMYRIGREDTGAERGGLPVVLDHQKMTRFLPEWVTQLDDGAVAALPPPERDAVRLAREWAAGPDPELLRRPSPLVFSRVDANFLNCLCDGRRVAIVDYEFAGWKDWIIDLADLIEVDAATDAALRRPRVPEDEWAWFAERFSPSPEGWRRLLAARRWLAWHFVFRYAPSRTPAEASHTAPSRTASFEERFAALLSHARALANVGH